jgi:hypothetical protein
VSIRNNLKKSSELDAYNDGQKTSVQNVLEHAKKNVVNNAFTSDRRVERKVQLHTRILACPVYSSSLLGKEKERNVRNFLKWDLGRDSRLSAVKSAYEVSVTMR